MARRWVVRGGVGKGGILVRTGSELSSPQLPSRLSTGAVVKEVGREGERLEYELLGGTGPPRGWVSIALGDKELLVQSREGGEDPMLDVQVVTLGAGVVAELKLRSSSTAEDVQEALCKVLGAPEAEQHLLIGTQELKGPARLSDLVAGPTVEITLLQTKRVGLASLTGCDGGSLHLWDLESGRSMGDFQSMDCAVTCASLNLESKEVLCGSEDGVVRLLSMAEPEPRLELNAHPGGVTCVDVDWVTRRALSGGQDHMLRLWDLEYGEVLSEMCGHRGPVTAVFWDCGLGCAISGSFDCCLRIWNVHTGNTVRELQGHMAPVNCVTANFGRQIAISGSIAIVRVWHNIATRGTHEVYRDHEGHSGWVISVAADWSREVILSLDQEGTMRFFSPEGGQTVRPDEPIRHPTRVMPLWASGLYLQGCDDGLLRLIRQDGTLEKEVQAHDSRVLCLAVDGDGIEPRRHLGAPPTAVVLLSFPVTATRRNIFEVQFPSAALGGRCSRPTVGQVRKELAEHHTVPYLERLRFLRPSQKQALGDDVRVPLPPEELEVAGPGSVLQSLMLAMQGSASGPEAAPPEATEPLEDGAE